MFGNRQLLGGVGFSLVFAALVVYVPALHGLFGTALLGPVDLLVVAPFPFLVWGADELRKAVRRRQPEVAAPRAPARGADLVEPARHHQFAVLLARHGWSGRRLSQALGVSERAAAEIVDHARHVAAQHGRQAPPRRDGPPGGRRPTGGGTSGQQR